MKFKFSIGGFYSGHYEVVLKNKHLLCFISDYAVEPLEPTHSFRVQDDPDWQILLQYLKSLKWKATYSAAMCDGTQWNLEFRYEDIRLQCYGSNAYPAGFKKLLRLLNNITSKHGISSNF